MINNLYSSAPKSSNLKLLVKGLCYITKRLKSILKSSRDVVAIRPFSATDMSSWVTVSLVVLVSVALLPHDALCACKAHDAWWDRSRGPTISQPARTDPTKVRVNWNAIIENARCVDFYHVYAWKQGQTKEQGRKLRVDKAAVDVEVTVEPCVTYYFAVEAIERDWTHTDEEMSSEARFKTDAIPSFTNTDKRNFVVGYAFDQVFIAIVFKVHKKSFCNKTFGYRLEMFKT